MDLRTQCSEHVYFSLINLHIQHSSQNLSRIFVVKTSIPLQSYKKANKLEKPE